MSSTTVKVANKKVDQKIVRRIRRKRRIRGKIRGTAARPRLTVFRSNRHFVAQLIDDVAGVTLVGVSSCEKALRSDANITAENVSRLALELVKRAKDKNITSLVFDRNGYRYHGIIKAFADGVRKGINF